MVSVTFNNHTILTVESFNIEQSNTEYSLFLLNVNIVDSIYDRIKLFHQKLFYLLCSLLVQIIVTYHMTKYDK